MATLAKRTLGAGTDVASTDGATTLSISPTGMQDGDWLEFGVCSSGGTGAHTNTAGGLTRVHADLAGGTTIVTSTWKKKCGPSESGPYTFSFGGSTRRATINVTCWSGGDLTDIVESAPAQISAATSTTIAAPGVDPVATGGVHIIHVFSRTAGGVAQTFDAVTNYTQQNTKSSTHATNANANGSTYSRALPDANATGDITCTVQVNDRLNVASILLKPAAGTDLSDNAFSVGPILGTAQATSAIGLGADAKSTGPMGGTKSASSQASLASSGYSSGALIGISTVASSIATAITDDAKSTGPLVGSGSVFSGLGLDSKAYSAGPFIGKATNTSTVGSDSSARGLGPVVATKLANSLLALNTAVNGGQVAVLGNVCDSRIELRSVAGSSGALVGLSTVDSDLRMAVSIADFARGFGFWAFGNLGSDQFGTPLVDSGGRGVDVDIAPNGASADSFGYGVDIDIAPKVVG